MIRMTQILLFASSCAIAACATDSLLPRRDCNDVRPPESVAEFLADGSIVSVTSNSALSRVSRMQSSWMASLLTEMTIDTRGVDIPLELYVQRSLIKKPVLSSSGLSSLAVVLIPSAASTVSGTIDASLPEIISRNPIVNRSTLEWGKMSAARRGVERTHLEARGNRWQRHRVTIPYWEPGFVSVAILDILLKECGEHTVLIASARVSTMELDWISTDLMRMLGD